MEKKQPILYVSQSELFVRRGDIVIKESKKIVITVNKCYVFWNPNKEIIEPPPAEPKKNIGILDVNLPPGDLDMELAQEEVNDNLLQEEKEFYSITGQPEYIIQIVGKHCKLVDQQHQILEMYLQRNQIEPCSVKNSVLLVDSNQRKIQFFFFDTQEHALRFTKAIECVNAWEKYIQLCDDYYIERNNNWARLLEKFIYHPTNTIILDPEDFLDGTDDDIEKEIKIVSRLIDTLSIINGIQFKFIINEDYGFMYLNLFLTGIQNLRNVRKLIMSECKLDDTGIIELAKTPSQLSGIIQLDLSFNNLTDISFQALLPIFIIANYLKKCNFSHNKFTLQLSEWFKDLLKSAHQYLILNFSHNSIDDKSIDSLQGTIIYSENPPVEKLDISHNNFSANGIRRIFIGQTMNKDNHSYMELIIYPLQFVEEIFTEKATEWQPIMASVKQSTQTEEEMPEEDVKKKQSIGIKILKINVSGKKVPTMKKQIQTTREIIQHLSISIDNDDLQEVYYYTKLIKSSFFQFPITALKKTHFYLIQKMNEVLFFRNHKYITKVGESASFIGLNLSVYRQRMELVSLRKQLFSGRLFRFLNFQMHEMEIVTEMQNIVKQALRLNLGGPAIKILFTLKLSKDRIVKQLINQEYNPELQLRDRRIQNYIKLYEYGVASDQEIPLQLKQQQQINSNLFQVYIQANYFVLAQIPKKQYEVIQSLLKTDQSTPKKFFNFILLAKQRLQFITNEYYNSFSPIEFSISFQELKINVCRLLWNYNNIEVTQVYSQIPNFQNKVPINPQRNIRIVNRSKFIKTYSLFNCQKIKPEAKAHGILDWKETYTIYTEKQIMWEIEKVNYFVDRMLRALLLIKTDLKDKMNSELLDLIRCVRQSHYPDEVLEQMYIQIMCFKSSVNQRIADHLSKIIPFLTMYLRPPLSIEKELIAYLSEQNFNFQDNPLSISFNKMSSKFVDRDWVPNDKKIGQLLKSFGKIKVPISTPGRPMFFIQLPESSTVQQLFNRLMVHESIARFTDKTLFWIYRYNKVTNEETIIMMQDYIGEIMSTLNEETDVLLVRRRIYEPYYIVCYQKFKQTDTVLNSIYHEVKYFYLRGFAYKVNFDMVLHIAKIIATIQIFDRKSNDYENDLRNYSVQLKSKIYDLFPIPYIKKKYKAILEHITEIKSYLQQNKTNKSREFLDYHAHKQAFLDIFRDYQFFCSTNYQIIMKGKEEKVTLISINSQFIYLQEIQTAIFYEDVLLVIPRQKQVVLEAYNKINQVTFSITLLTNNHRISVSIAMDILSYCTLRLLISNKFLYYQRQLHEDLMVKNKLDLSMFDGSMTSQKIVEQLAKNRHSQDIPAISDLVTKIRKNYQQLQGMELITFKQKDIINCQKNRFCKYQLERESYPNRKRNRSRADTDLSNMTFVNPEGIEEIVQKKEETERTLKAEEATMMKTRRSEEPITTTERKYQESVNDGYGTFRTFQVDQTFREGDQSQQKIAEQEQQQIQQISDEDHKSVSVQASNTLSLHRSQQSQLNEMWQLQ